MKIALCVLTYRRPAGLTRLLESIAELRVTDPSCERPVVVVVDNDPAGTMRELCTSLATRLKLNVEYYVEPARGIPSARNRALAATVDRFDFLAFIDDDEVVPATWLDELVRCQRRYDADVVTGPMVPHFPTPPASWVQQGGYFASPRSYATGTRRPVAASGNVLIATRALRESGINFDTRFALSGGSDTHFFMRLARAGHAIVWCNEALAVEWIPDSRATAAWLLRRAFRLGTTSGLCARDLDARRPHALALRSAKGLARIAQGALLLPVYAVMPGRRAVDALRLVWYGSGIFAGLAGRHFLEYAQVHVV